MSFNRSDVYLLLCAANEVTGAEKVAANIHFVFVPVAEFNRGVSRESKSLAWARITDDVKRLEGNHREVCLSACLSDRLSAYLPV